MGDLNVKIYIGWMTGFYMCLRIRRFITTVSDSSNDNIPKILLCIFFHYSIDIHVFNGYPDKLIFLFILIYIF